MRGLARWMRRLGRWTLAAVAAAALLLALGIGAFRLAIGLLPGWQAQVVERVREQTGLRLEFESVHARIGRYGPEVVFRGARVLPAAGDEPLVTADAGRVSLSLLRSAWYRRIELGRVMLVRPRLHFVIHTDGSVRMVGQRALQGAPDAERPPFTLDRLPRGRFAVRDATLDVLDLRARQGRFELTGADLEMVRRGNHVTLSGQVELPEHLGAGLEFSAETEGDLADFDALPWTATLDARRLDLAQWKALLPESFFVPEAGYGSIAATVRGTGKQPEALRVEPVFEELQLPGVDGPYTRVAGDIRVRRDGDAVTLEATGFELSREGAPWRPNSLDSRIVRADGRLALATLRADYLRIENVAALAPLLPAGAARDRLVELAPSGELYGVDLAVADAGPQRLPEVRGRLRFSDLGFEPVGRAAGMTGLDGSLEGYGDGGIVQVTTRDALIKWPLQWRALNEMRRAEGRVEWSRFANGVRLWLDDGFVDTGHGSARGRLRMLLRPGELPLMDLQATATDFDLTQTWRYLQIERLRPRTIAWLDAAFRRGRVPEAEVSITGPTRGFPYREGQGRFVATGRATGLDLHFAPGWPEIRGIETDFRFDGPAMQALANRGAVGGVEITGAEASSADLRDAVVAARASMRSDAGRVLRLLQGSPIAPSFGEAFAELAGSGRVEGDIALFLPLREFERRVITVHGRLDRVTLRHRSQPLEVKELSGPLWVRNREIQAPALQARLLGGPLRLAVATTVRADGELDTQVTAQGGVRGEQLVPAANLPVNAGLAGAADWRGFLSVRRSADGSRPAQGDLRISSDLRGLALGLPEPFDKQAETARPLTVNLRFDGVEPPRVRAQLGRDVHALLRWRSRAEDPPIERGILRFGQSAPSALPAVPGLRIEGRVESASLSALLGLRWERPGRHPLHRWVAGAELELGRIEVLGYDFERVRASLRPGNRAWEIDVEGPDAAGHLTVPHSFPGEVPLALDLDRLRFGARAAVPGTAADPGDPDPRGLPAIRADLRDFVFDGRRFGHVRAEFTRGTAGMTLNQFTMRHPSFTATGSGSWLVRQQRAECRLDFDVETADVQGFLEAMQLGSLVAANRGRVAAKLQWTGPPETKAIERLSGRLEISASDGRLTAVEPGAGRVFGLMSLAHLPRRLALDFGDLTGEGLSFDTLTGSFQLDDGEAMTDNLTLRGSAAEIGIAGRTSLRHRTYDQTAIVTGQLGASLGVAGALAGGPAVGAALLLFSQIFKEPLKGATRGYYRITGSWDDPQVRRVEARELRDSRQAGSQGAPEAAPAPPAEEPAP